MSLFFQTAVDLSVTATEMVRLRRNPTGHRDKSTALPFRVAELPANAGTSCVVTTLGNRESDLSARLRRVHAMTATSLHRNFRQAQQRRTLSIQLNHFGTQ